MPTPMQTSNHKTSRVHPPIEIHSNPTLIHPIPRLLTRPRLRRRRPHSQYISTAILAHSAVRPLLLRLRTPSQIPHPSLFTTQHDPTHPPTRHSINPVFSRCYVSAKVPARSANSRADMFHRKFRNATTSLCRKRKLHGERWSDMSSVVCCSV